MTRIYTGAAPSGVVTVSLQGFLSDEGAIKFNGLDAADRLEVVQRVLSPRTGRATDAAPRRQAQRSRECELLHRLLDGIIDRRLARRADDAHHFRRGSWVETRPRKRKVHPPVESEPWHAANDDWSDSLAADARETQAFGERAFDVDQPWESDAEAFARLARGCME